MAFINCPECKKQISDQALQCPHCGFTFRRYRGFQWRTEFEIMGFPLVHVAIGRDSRTGKLLVAKGIIAIGQFGIGVITIAQFGIGFLFGFGQGIIGFTAVAQAAITIYFAIGQLAIGQTAIGQLAIGEYVLGQATLGKFMWNPEHQDPQAVEYFKQLWQNARQFLKIQ